MKALQIKKYGDIREGLAFNDVDKPKYKKDEISNSSKSCIYKSYRL